MSHATDPRDRPYIPAARFHWLTRWYDGIVRLTTRESVCKRRLVELAGLQDGDRVLDLGCGTGTLTVALAGSASSAVVTGLDADEEALSIARKKADAAGRTVSFQRGFAQEMPFAEGQFNVVVSSLFFHHLNRKAKRAVLSKVREVLRPGGRLAVADWGKPVGPISRTMFLVVQALDGFETTRDSVDGTLPQLILEAGFEDLREHEPSITPLGVMRFWHASVPHVT